jgi:serine phosphatase RsbU (regulator of sigma subunit)
MDRAQMVGAALAALWLVALAVFDLAIPGGRIVLSPLFAISPLIACAVLPASATAGFAGAAVLLAVAAGAWDGTWATAQQTVRLVDVALVGAAAVVVAAVRVHREERHARVVAIAEIAQRAILPTVPRRAGPVAASVRYLSAAEDAVVGGDLYDCYHSAAHTRFLVGDVRGKGIGAVEQAARVIRAFRQSAATEATLAGVAEGMSSYLQHFFDDEEFVTAVLVEVTDDTTLTLVSCGHPQPLLVRGEGPASTVDLPAGLPLGLGEAYESATMSWRQGDRLLAYTDGLSEARDGQGRFLPVLTLAPAVKADSVDHALDDVLDAVRQHVPRGRLSDDLAVMLLENVGGPSAAPGEAEVTLGVRP